VERGLSLATLIRKGQKSIHYRGKKADKRKDETLERPLSLMSRTTRVLGGGVINISKTVERK